MTHKAGSTQIALETSLLDTRRRLTSLGDASGSVLQSASLNKLLSLTTVIRKYVRNSWLTQALLVPARYAALSTGEARMSRRAVMG